MGEPVSKEYRKARDLLGQHVRYAMVMLSKTTDELKREVRRIELVCFQEGADLSPETIGKREAVLNLIDEYSLAAQRALEERNNQIRDWRI